MASSTEDYLDSLLRQAMGIPDPEPEKKPEPDTSDLEREDVLAMADGLTGSNSAILGNAYDHNASFTNEGEIQTAAAPTAVVEPVTDEAVNVIPVEDMPDPDAPPVAETIPDVSNIIPEDNLAESVAIPEPEPVAVPEPEPVVMPEAEPVAIPEGPVVEHDGNLDIIPEPEMMTEIEMPAIEEPAIEELGAEEPAIEEPVIEEPAIEEPVIEEPAAEEPAAPTMSIDDLDPNNSLQALDADTIAALFAGANAAEVPAAEEEPVVEEEPAIEEESATEEEPVAEEEPAAEGDLLEGGEDAELEELSISLDDTDDAPLMPDQEISDLLSTLGELSGETPEEPEEAAGEESAEETAGDEGSDEAAAEEPSADESASGDGASDVDLGGLDVFDTDLSAMLDDVTNSLESENAGGEEASSDADLNDLLGAFGDDSGELSDIGDLLNKDENSELVDPNTETAEALFASDSEEDLFNIDNLIDEEENPKGKKKKKKFSLFGKKKKKSDNIEVIGGDEEMLIDPELLDIPDESEIKSRKPGFFATLFAKLFEEVGEDEDTPSGIEQSAVDIAQEGAAENEAILSELEEEGAGEDKKKKKKEKKKKEKKDKKAKESGGEGEGEEGEEAAEDTKKKKKKEKKKKEKLPEIPGKKLPRKKVVAISLFCITIGIVITFLAFMIPYSQDIKKAKKFYTTGEYQKTYEYMRGHKLTSDDQLLYNRTITLLRIKRPYDSYQNYMKMGLRMEALNALVQGVQMIDRYAEEAATLGIIDKYSKQSRLIYDELYNTFGVTVDKARSWIELEGSPEYTHALYEALLDKSGIREEQSGLPEDLEASDDPVINAEENDL